MWLNDIFLFVLKVFVSGMVVIVDLVLIYFV